jgi:endonuclease/exonuclease/phosphatase family metal-dependent hydrolase
MAAMMSHMTHSAKRCAAIVFVGLVCCLVTAQTAHGETITIGSYNIERFQQRFIDSKSIADKDLAAQLRAWADKNNWMASETILNPKFSPDILVVQECADQAELEKFNKQWLKGLYETVIVFPSNSDRKQSLAIMTKPGFKVVERKDQYYLDKDPAGANERGDRLFARGPVFCKVQTPSGYTLWVGTTHQKSKGGNNVEITKWRKREAQRTNQILKELEKAGPDDVVLLGDMNDEFGMQEYELEAGGDVIADLVGSPSDGFILATKPLSDAGKISFGGYWNPRYRSFIDHIVISKGLKDQVEQVDVFTDDLARAASDHYPVFIRIKTNQ